MNNSIRNTRLPLLLGLALLLAACGNHGDQPVLAHVPANTPFVVANLEPLPPEVLENNLAMANAQIPQQVNRLRQIAAQTQDDAPNLARLLGTLADTLDGHTWPQVFAQAGIKLNGLYAAYGLGLSPALRGQLDDGAKFEAFVDRLLTAADAQAADASVGGIAYRHIDLPKAKLRVVMSHHDGQFMFALLPMRDDDSRLRLAVGADLPEDSVVGRLAELADSRGYSLHGLGFVDIGALLATLASGSEPMLTTSLAQLAASDSNGNAEQLLAQLHSPACRSDLERIAARVPLVSGGYTHIDAHQASARIIVDLAPDIAAAFAGLQVPLPGLGAETEAPVSITMALPMPAIRDFWVAQAKAVAAGPFTCQPLAGLNKAFAKLAMAVPMIGVPPWGNLRGLRVVIDSIRFEDNKDKIPAVSARVLVAMDQPESVWAMAQAMLEPLRQIKLEPNGTPVALPWLTKLTSEPAFLVMSDNAIAGSVGARQGNTLQAMLDAKPGYPGQLFSEHLDGSTVAQWIRSVGKLLDDLPAADAAKDAKVMANAAESIEAAAKTYEHIEHIDMGMHMTAQGLVMESTVVLRNKQ